MLKSYSGDKRPSPKLCVLCRTTNHALFFVCSGLDGSADQFADESAEERGADFAPVLRVEGVAVVMVVVVFRRMVPCGCCVVFRRLPRRGGALTMRP